MSITLSRLGRREMIHGNSLCQLPWCRWNPFSYRHPPCSCRVAILCDETIDEETEMYSVHLFCICFTVGLYSTGLYSASSLERHPAVTGRPPLRHITRILTPSRPVLPDSEIAIRWKLSLNNQKPDQSLPLSARGQEYHLVWRGRESNPDLHVPLSETTL